MQGTNTRATAQPQLTENAESTSTQTRPMHLPPYIPHPGPGLGPQRLCLGEEGGRSRGGMHGRGEQSETRSAATGGAQPVVAGWADTPSSSSTCMPTPAPASPQGVQAPAPYPVPVPMAVPMAYPVPMPIYIDRPTTVYVERLVPHYVDRPVWVDRPLPILVSPMHTGRLQQSLALWTEALAPQGRPQQGGSMETPGPGRSMAFPWPREGAVAPPLQDLLAAMLQAWQHQQQSQPSPSPALLAIEWKPPQPESSMTGDQASQQGIQPEAEASEGSASHPCGVPQTGGSMAVDRPSQLGKRPAEEDNEDTASQASELSQGTQPRQRKMRYGTIKDWPQAWRTEYDAFKAAGSGTDRRKLAETWDAALWDQVFCATTTQRRTEMRRWEREKARASAHTPNRPPVPRETPDQHDPTAHNPNSTMPSPTRAEATSHDWKEGARMGEATNPGPPPGGPHHSSPHQQSKNPRNQAHPNQHDHRRRRPKRREPGSPWWARQAHQGSGPHRKPQQPVTNNNSNSARRADRSTRTGATQPQRPDARGGTRRDGPDPIMRHPQTGGHLHTEQGHNHPNNQQEENWEVVQPPPRRLHRKLKHLEQAIAEIKKLLEATRQRPVPKAPPAGQLWDDNPWFALRHKQGRHTSIGFQHPSRAQHAAGGSPASGGWGGPPQRRGEGPGGQRRSGGGPEGHRQRLYAGQGPCHPCPACGCDYLFGTEEVEQVCWPAGGGSTLFWCNADGGRWGDEG